MSGADQRHEIEVALLILGQKRNIAITLTAISLISVHFQSGANNRLNTEASGGFGKLQRAKKIIAIGHR